MEENNAKKTQIDYIHGGDEVIELGKTIGNTGILLPEDLLSRGADVLFDDMYEFRSALPEMVDLELKK